MDNSSIVYDGDLVFRVALGRIYSDGQVKPVNPQTLPPGARDPDAYYLGIPGFAKRVAGCQRGRSCAPIRAVLRCLNGK